MRIILKPPFPRCTRCGVVYHIVTLKPHVICRAELSRVVSCKHCGHMMHGSPIVDNRTAYRDLTKAEIHDVRTNEPERWARIIADHERVIQNMIG